MRRSTYGNASSESGARTTHDYVARSLGCEIIAGQYAPGENIPAEAELLHRFQVSRTVLREVIKTLAAKGLVASKTRVGTKVQDRSSWNFFDADVLSWRTSSGFDETFRREIVEIRLALEPRAAASAARNCAPGSIETMRRACLGMRQSRRSSQEFAEADLEFHEALLEASGNALMRSVSAVIEVAALAALHEVSDILTDPQHDEALHEQIVRGHELVVDAIERRDPDGAAQALRNVIQQGVDLVRVSH
jgi:DNA-binding FadR family transcriptional regulator